MYHMPGLKMFTCHLKFKRLISWISIHVCWVMNLNEKTLRQTHSNLNSSFFSWRDLQVLGTLATRKRESIFYLTVERRTFYRLNIFRVKFWLQSSQQQNCLRILKGKFPYLIVSVFEPSFVRWWTLRSDDYSQWLLELWLSFSSGISEMYLLSL